MATYALIPGAGGDAWEWHLVARELEARGHVAVARLAPDGRRRRGLERVRRCGRGGDRRSIRRRPRRAVARRLHRAARLRAAPGRPHRPPQRDDPGPRRDRQRLVGATSAAARRSARTSRRSASRDRTPEDDRVIYFHDVPDAVVEEALLARRAAAVDDAHGPALCARGLARRPDPGARRPRRSPLPGRVPAPRRRASASGSRPT